MADRRDDARGKKIVFMSSCLLNTNNKVKGLARYSGMCREVFDTLCDNGLGIQQMDCPETLYLGIQRWWYTKNLYDCRGFRDHCRELAERSVTYMEEYAREGLALDDESVDLPKIISDFRDFIQSVCQ